MTIVPVIQDPMIRINYVNYTLSNAVTEYEIDKVDGEVVESVINGDVSMIYKGKRFEGTITVYGLDESTNQIYKGAERTTIRLWPLGVGAIAGTNPQKYYPWCDVFVISVTPFHKDNKLYHDACIIRFKSTSFYTMERAATLGYTPT